MCIRDSHGYSVRTAASPFLRTPPAFRGPAQRSPAPICRVTVGTHFGAPLPVSHPNWVSHASSLD
eukprot:1174350-Pyramimonas_sp.AAC.1